MALLRRKRALTGSGLRIQTVRSSRSSLVAAAARLDLSDRPEAARQLRLRQGWQLNAWAYRDSIGELRYAVNFLANCAARMKVYPAAYAQGAESDNPVALGSLQEEVPAEVITACAEAMAALGNGRLALSHVMHGLSTNQSVAGECWLLGQSDPQTGLEEWSIRSISEVQIKDDRYYLRQLPTDSQGIFGAEELDPETTVISRIWAPHPQWRLLADSPMRAMQDDCESLLILRRMIRAAGRSRLAGAGILAIPDELQIKSPQNDNEDAESDDFLGSLAEAMMMPLDNEGAASAVVPIVVRGPGEHLKNIIHIKLADQFAAEDATTRAELLGVIARTLDLPPEVLTGTADLNHWSAWQVDDNTFRHHVEPHVIHCCDSLTAAFLRPYLSEEGIDPEWVRRLVLWFDPVELVTHPDQTSDAKDLYDRHALSAQALARISGFDQEDMPSPEETVVRMLQNMRTPPANLVMAAVHQMFPTLTIPPISTSGTVPGVKPSGVDPGAADLLGPGVAPAPVAIDSAPPATSSPPADQPAPGPPAITAAGAAQSARLSRKLVEVDRDLRARLQTAANAAMLRQLERAGAKLRSKVARDETMRSKIAHRANERAAAFIGREALGAAGLSATELLSGDWSALRAQWGAWVADSQRQALRIAGRLAPLSEQASAQASAQMAQGRAEGWAALEASLAATSQHLLYDPDPNSAAGDWGELNPDTLVPTGTIRAALALAGGAGAGAITSDGTGAISLAGPVGQIGSGQIISGALADAGGQSDQFEWVHGPALHPFEPHEALDGVQFQSFDDEALANAGDFPDNAYYMPGDHDGCSCDFSPLWDFPGNPANDSTEGD